MKATYERIDTLVKFWIKDVPYFIREKNKKYSKGKDEWRKYERVYITRSKAEYDIIHKFVSNISDKCNDVLGYFQTSNKIENFNLRMNGYELHIPIIEIRGRNIDIFSYIGKKPINEVTIIMERKLPKSIILPSESTESESLSYEDIPDALYDMLWYLRNLGKYHNICTPVSQANCDHPIEIYFLIIKILSPDFNDFHIIYDAVFLFGLCLAVPTIRFIYIPISWQYRFGKHDAHANLMVLDLVERHMILIDPWGKGQYEEINALLPQIIEFLGLQSSEWKIYNSDDICPAISFQKLENERPEELTNLNRGYCEVWSLWLFELRLKNQELSWPELIKLAIQSIGDHFHLFIKRYARSIIKHGKQICKPSKQIPYKVKADLGTKINKYISSLRQRIRYTDGKLFENSLVFTINSNYKLIKFSKDLMLDKYRRFASYLWYHKVSFKYLPTFRLFLIYNMTGNFPPIGSYSNDFKTIFGIHDDKITIIGGKIIDMKLQDYNQTIIDLYGIIDIMPSNMAKMLILKSFPTSLVLD